MGLESESAIRPLRPASERGLVTPSGMGKAIARSRSPDSSATGPDSVAGRFSVDRSSVAGRSFVAAGFCRPFFDPFAATARARARVAITVGTRRHGDRAST